MYNSQKKSFEESADESDNSPDMYSLFQNIAFKQ